MDPSDHDQNDLGNEAAGGDDRPRHANWTPGEGDRWLRSVVEHSSEIVTVVDPDGTLRYANPAWERVLGYDLDEAIGTMNVVDHVHPEDLAHVLEEMERAPAEGTITTNEAGYRLRHRDGSWRWVESVGTYLLNDPEVRGVVMVSRDVTERKEAEEALRRSEAEIFSVLESITDAFFALDRELRFTYVNLQAEVLFSTRREDLVGEKVWKDPTFYPQYERAVTEGETVAFEGYYPPSGAWYSVRAYPSESGLSVYLQDVTGRKGAEIRLREAEERYRNLVEQIPAVTYIDETDEVSSAIYMSPQVEGMLGYTPQEWLKDPEFWIKILHPDDKERILAEDRRTNETGDPFGVEYRMISKSGHVVWVRDDAVLVRDGEDRPLFWQGILYDITERRRVEAALRESEERFRRSFDDAAIGMALVALDGCWIRVNRSLCEILGYPEEELLGRTFQDITHPDNLDADLDQVRRMLAGEIRTYQMEKRYFHKEGHMVWVLLSVSLVRDVEDEPLYFVSQIQDVTGRKEAEEALKVAEERYRNLVERIPAVTYIDSVDDPDNSLYTSPQIEEMLGYTPEEWLTQKLWPKRLHPDDRDRILAADEGFEKGGGERFDEEYRLLAKDGSVVWVREEAVLVKDGEGNPLYWQGVIYDVTERREAEERLEHQALHDPLTGLPNRRLFVDRLKQALRRTRRQGGRGAAVLFMDLDDFKVVNDSLGHEAGDLLLVVVAQRLKRCLRPEDTLARFGGDEFVVLLEDVEDPGEAVRVAQRITDELRRPFVPEGRELYVSASVGISFGTARTKSPEDLLRDADTAMYQAKRDGSGYRVFDPAMYERVVQRLDLENDVRRAVDAGEFVVYYQPIFDFGSQEPWGVEALVRWKHPERGLLGPSEFMPVAEETGLIVPIGAWVLREACRRTKEWQDDATRNPPLAVIVNLSAKQLRHPDCEKTIREALIRSGLAARSLSLDVTETAFIDALEDNTLTLERIQATGVRISIDDFGMGYSSLSYLKRLPADALKIDKSFLKGFGEDAEDTAIVRMVIEVAHTLGLQVVAEGVETWAQAALLAETGCDMAQGFHFAEPLPPEAASQFLNSTYQSFVHRNDADSLFDS